MGVPSPASGSSSAATPFPEGDPRNGKYFENLAALEHSLNTTLAGDQQGLTDAQSAYQYNTGQLDRQLPLTLQTTRNAANSQGLLESGQMAQRAGSVEAAYAAKRGEAARAYQSEQNKVHQNEQSAGDAFNLGRVRAATEAREEALKQTEAESPNEQTTPTPPAVVAQHAQPRTGGAPRVAGRRSQPSAGANRRAARQRAARRAAGRVGVTGGTPAGVG